MALNPENEQHALQIQAGTIGRKAGHAFEDTITKEINIVPYPLKVPTKIITHVNIGDPARLLLFYISSVYGYSEIIRASALSTGALATSEDGKRWLEINGIGVARCKSDLVISLEFPNGIKKWVGVSTKQCNNKTPTNAQLYFTTARGFVTLLTKNSLKVSDAAITALRQFCGDIGFRPVDQTPPLTDRKTDPRRFFWEEILEAGRLEWENIFSKHQDNISRLLLQKAYLDDQFPPDFLIHKTKNSTAWENTEIALYSINELIHHSKNYGGFSLKPYSVRKGSYKDPQGVAHIAPRFGIIQMQRGGQAQHPEQLQFNLEAGYFYKISQQRPDVNSQSSSQ